MITKVQIETQRQIVRTSYVNNNNYETEFDKLHELNMKYMKQLYTKTHGRSESANFKTPYD